MAIVIPRSRSSGALSIWSNATFAASPFAAVNDVWDPTEFDEVVISTMPTGASKWLQVDLPHRVEKIAGVPVTHVVAEPPRTAPKAEPARRTESLGVLDALTAITGKRPERSSRRG